MMRTARRQEVEVPLRVCGVWVDPNFFLRLGALGVSGTAALNQGYRFSILTPLVDKAAEGPQHGERLSCNLSLSSREQRATACLS